MDREEMNISETIKRQEANHRRLGSIGTGWHTTEKKPRRNINKEVKAGKIEVINQAIEMIRNEIRAQKMPESWNRGYYAAISKLERLRDEI